jgi:uncharacterized OB-fold protein
VSEIHSFTIESFYKFVGEGKLMGAKCARCGAVILPPRPVCSKCFSHDLNWVQIKNNGKLLTYTVIYVASKQFEASAPYSIGIVKLDDGPQLLGRIRGVEPNELKVGMSLRLDFEKTSPPQPADLAQWPAWPRYYFKPE